MRKLGFNLLAFVAATAFVGQVSAQPPGPGGPGGGRPIPPVMAALDADTNGEISAKELENASKALAALDKNKDGKLTEDELRPEMGRGGEAAEDLAELAAPVVLVVAAARTQKKCSAGWIRTKTGNWAKTKFPNECKRC